MNHHDAIEKALAEEESEALSIEAAHFNRQWDISDASYTAYEANLQKVYARRDRLECQFPNSPGHRCPLEQIAALIRAHALEYVKTTMPWPGLTGEHLAKTQAKELLSVNSKFQHRVTR